MALSDVIRYVDNNFTQFNSINDIKRYLKMKKDQLGYSRYDSLLPGLIRRRAYLDSLVVPVVPVVPTQVPIVEHGITFYDAKTLIVKDKTKKQGVNITSVPLEVDSFDKWYDIWGEYLGNGKIQYIKIEAFIQWSDELEERSKDVEVSKNSDKDEVFQEILDAFGLGGYGAVVGITILWEQSFVYDTSIILQEEREVRNRIYKAFNDLVESEYNPKFNTLEEVINRNQSQLDEELERATEKYKRLAKIEEQEKEERNSSDSDEFGDISLEHAELMFSDSGIDNNLGKDNKCVERYLNKIWGKESKVSKLGISRLCETTPTINTLYDFCVENNLPMKAYDVEKVLQKENKSTKKVKGLNFIAYNSHMYGLNTGIGQLIKRSKTFDIIECAGVIDKIAELIKRGKIPDDIKFKNGNVFSAQYGTDKYIESVEYYHCKSLLEKLNIGEEIKEHSSMINLIDTIEKSYINEPIWSYTPSFEKSTITACIYQSKDYQIGEELNARDANKFYPSILKGLEYVVSHNFMRDKIYKYNNQKIEDHFIYLIEIESPTIILPFSQAEPGFLLKYAQNKGIPFKILEVMECKKHRNVYSTMLSDIFEKLGDEAKKVICPLFGKLQSEYHKHGIKLKYHKISNHAEYMTNDYETIPISSEGGLESDKNMYLQYTIEKFKSRPKIFSKKPIFMQIIAKARIKISEEIKKLGNPEVMLIKTDCIMFRGENNGEHSTEFGKWKNSTYVCDDRQFHIVKPKVETLIPEKVNQTNSRCISYAGCGKSYYIKNTLIPQYKNPLIITPTWQTCSSYKSENMNAEVIQLFTNGTKLPQGHDAYIFDEVGMYGADMWSVVIELVMEKVPCHIFGDFNQLKPVGYEMKISTQFLDWMFPVIVKLEENHRNKFTKGYYNLLIENNTEKYALEQIQRFETNPTDAQVIICYRNETVDKYNESKMKKLNIEFGGIGCKVLCKTNNLSKYGIFNNYLLTITKKEGGSVHFDNGTVIPEKKLKLYIDKKSKGYFKPGYAMTLHAVQGQDLDSFHVAKKDLSFMSRGNILYTIISRLKQG